jgi:RND family efflux transporter MFP subunit
MVERGALVGPAVPLFRLAATDPVRVVVHLPQEVAPTIEPGLAARIVVREYGARRFAGQVSRSAGELDPTERTMVTEIRVPNPDGALLPGMYVQAELTLPVPHRVLEVPATAVFTDAQGVRVAVVDAASKLHFVAIAIERDTGGAIQVAGGLTGSERIVRVAQASLAEGQEVEVVP